MTGNFCFLFHTLRVYDVNYGSILLVNVLSVGIEKCI